MSFEHTAPAEEVKATLAAISGVPAGEIHSYLYLLADADGGQICFGSNGRRKEDMIALLDQAMRIAEAQEYSNEPAGEPS